MSGEIFETEIQDTYTYRLSYGGQSSFFHGLAAGKLIGSRCKGCAMVWTPGRPICSDCYGETEEITLSGKARALTVVPLPVVPEHLKHLGKSVASALVVPEGSDTCLKAFFLGTPEEFRPQANLIAHYLPEISTIADFYFVAEPTKNSD